MKTYGLIGHKLGHSFSKKFFTEKFKKEHLSECEYVNFELDTINGFPELFKRNDHIYGLNCTIPYKQQVIGFLDETDPEAAKIGAVNTIKVIRHNDRIRLKGFNTDAYGFEHSFSPLLKEYHRKALILGTGGASKAVKYVLEKLGIDYLFVTTKTVKEKKRINYSEITRELLSHYSVIINATPLGTFPNTETCPDIPYQYLTKKYLLYDLVYNPEETLFMRQGKNMGAIVKNGLDMLHLQAVRAWEIWNS